MHVLKILPFALLGLWLYAFIGARLGRSIIAESIGLRGDDWVFRLLILLLWPFFGIVQYFEE